MILQRLNPLPEIAPYIDTVWIFENDFGVPVEDNRLIAPNGKAKVIYSYENGLSTIVEGHRTDYPENDIYLIGLWDRPCTLYSKQRKTGTVGIELKTEGAYRFVPMPLAEIANRLFSFNDLFGSPARMLVERLRHEPSVHRKAELLQRFLIARMREVCRTNVLLDQTVQKIRLANGQLEIAELSASTGYSRRYLDLLYRELLGVSPKTYASIARFQKIYKAWAVQPNAKFYRSQIYEHYYDQAHFIREFRRFTGYTPGQYARERNEFGRIFYK